MAVVAIPMLSLLAAVPAPQGRVFVVDPYGAGDFTKIADALVPAAPGDTVIVQDGSYPKFTLSEGVAVVAAEGAEVKASCTVTGVPAGESAILRGLTGTLELSASAGVIWIEEAQCPRMTVDACDAVVVVRSTATGVDGSCFGSFCDLPEAGVTAVDSRIYAFGSSFAGGEGHIGKDGFDGYPGSDGGPGAILDSTFLYLGGSTIAGGPGGLGHSVDIWCAAPGDGGPGILFEGGASEVQAQDSVLLGGEPGVDATPFGLCTGAVGQPGPTIAGPGAIATLPGAVLALHAPRTTASSAPIELALSGGEPGALAVLGLGVAPDPLFLPVLPGVVAAAGPHEILALGGLGPDGALDASIPAGALPAGVEALQVHAQAGYLSASAELVLGEPAVVTVTDVPTIVHTLWIVDVQGGGHFESISAALDVAKPGDVVLVESGEYLGFTLSKPLTIAADDDAIVRIGSSAKAVIRDLAQGERAVLSGIRCLQPLVLEQNDGVVWLQDVHVEVDDDLASGPAPGLDVEGCASVVLAGSTFRGGSQGPWPGIDAVDSEIHAYDVVAEGGAGRSGVSLATFQAPGSPGAAGLQLQGSRVIASGATFRGGAGGAGASEFALCGAPGDGGPGVRLVDATSELLFVDSELLGGAAGVDATPGGFCQGATGQPGTAVVGAGTVAPLSPHASLAMTVGSPVREGGAIDLALQGPAGAPAFLALGTGPLALFAPALSGTILVAPPYAVLPLGSLDAAGGLALQLPLGALPPAIEAQPFYGQAGYVAAGGAIVLGSPAVVLLLDSAF